MLYFMGSLALELGKDMQEMMLMPISELNFWAAYFKARQAKNEAAAKKAELKAKHKK